MNGEDYAARGPEFEAAWDELVVGCQVPPSLEVFTAGFERAARKSWHRGLSVEKYTAGLVENYRRIR